METPEFVAKKLCSELIIVPVDYKRVSAVSSKVITVCKKYDPNMYVAGCDEGYIKYVCCECMANSRSSS